MEKRLILAIALSLLVMLIFRTSQPKQTYFPTKTQTSVPEEPKNELIPEEIIPESPKEEKTTVIKTDRYILTFTNIGGSLKTVQLCDYIDTSTKAPLILAQAGNPREAIFAVKSNALTGALSGKEFLLEKKENDRIAYYYSIPGKFKIVKEYIFHKSNDYIELRLSIQNLSNAINYKEYDIMGASHLTTTDKSMGRRFLEINSMIDGKFIRNTNIKNNELFVPGIVSWTGVKERYFCIVLKPQQDSEGVILRKIDKYNLASGVRAKKLPIYATTIAEDSYILYIGPNDIQRLANVGYGLEQIVDYGIFGGITKFLLSALKLFQKITKNWGVAIILLTLLTNIVLFPLTKKSFSSMKKLQEVQPHIEKLRQLHKDNPQKLNRELAELYRQYNINPFGGCLPLLIQMPIFIALYQGLMRSIELKGATFLWVKDLSNPDYVHLPFNLPIFGQQLHILPIVMVIAMFAQQSISMKTTSSMSKEQEQQQKIMLYFFPVFFGFLFYNFPSGLVLYWLTNTILMTAEHYIMKRKVATA